MSPVYKSEIFKPIILDREVNSHSVSKTIKYIGIHAVYPGLTLWVLLLEGDAP
jgi:hypothetical protein